MDKMKEFWESFSNSEPVTKLLAPLSDWIDSPNRAIFFSLMVLSGMWLFVKRVRDNASGRYFVDTAHSNKVALLIFFTCLLASVGFSISSDGSNAVSDFFDRIIVDKISNS